MIVFTFSTYRVVTVSHGFIAPCTESTVVTFSNFDIVCLSVVFDSNFGTPSMSVVHTLTGVVIEFFYSLCVVSFPRPADTSTFCFAFAKHIIVGRLFKNIHPSLQYSSRSLILASFFLLLLLFFEMNQTTQLYI